MSSDPVILIERRGPVGLLTLNRPAQRNTMSLELAAALGPALAELSADRTLRAVVITGAGKHFCAGADFSALPALAGRTGLEGPAANLGAIHLLYQSFTVLAEVGLPTLAAINGGAVGGGLGLALLCDLRLAATDAKIAANFAKLGIHPGLGISARLIAAVGRQAAAELLYTGRTINGEEAARLGLVSRAVPPEKLLDAALELASEISANAPLALRALKRTLRLLDDPRLAAVLEIEAFAQNLLAGTADAAEGISAMLAKRPPKFEGR